MRFNKKKMRKLALWPVRTTINNIDFVKILERLARYEPGASFIKRPIRPSPSFTDQEDIIQHTIEMTERELLEKGRKPDRREIEDNARIISCRYDEKIHKITSAGVFNAITHVFDHQDLEGIFVSSDRRELKHLDTLLNARRENTGVVYLVNHSSHFDEFIVDVALEQLGIHLPLFAAGSNMMATPSLETVLMQGSYVIIRRGATKTYLATLFQYCRSLCELGKQQGIFLEAWAGGARTRDGSLRYPRRLVTLQGALESQKDILVQPVVLSYSIVPEDMGLAERAGGLSWISGSSITKNLLLSPHRPLRGMMRGVKNLFGRCYMTLCEPKYLSELEEMRNEDPSGLARDEFAALYCMNQIAKDKKIMASQLTARGLIRARKDRTRDLVGATEAELDDIVEYHRRTFHQEPDLEDFIRDNSMAEVVEDGLESLGRRKVIGKRAKSLTPPEVISDNGLQYYATHGDRRLYSPSAKENIVIVNANRVGYGLARLIGQRTLEDRRYHNSSMILFDAREDVVSGIIDTRTHPIHFENIRLPKNVFPTSDATAAFRKANDILITSPVKFFESDFRTVLAESPHPIRVIIATRGFEQTTHLLPIQIAERVLKDTGRSDVDLLVLSGPVTPDRLVESKGGTLVLAGPIKKAKSLSNLFNRPGFQVHVSNDPIGVQVAGTLSEVYSLYGSYLIRIKEMSGRLDIAAFIRETSVEAIRFATALGGSRETFQADNPAWVAEYVAAGMGGPGSNFGRLAGKSRGWTSATSTREFAQNASMEAKDDDHLVGYTGIRSAYIRCKELNLEMPRLREAYRLFWKDLD